MSNIIRNIVSENLKDKSVINIDLLDFRTFYILFLYSELIKFDTDLIYDLFT